MKRIARKSITVFIGVTFLLSSLASAHRSISRENYCSSEFNKNLENGQFSNQLGEELAQSLTVLYLNSCNEGEKCKRDEEFYKKLNNALVPRALSEHGSFHKSFMLSGQVATNTLMAATLVGAIGVLASSESLVLPAGITSYTIVLSAIPILSVEGISEGINNYQNNQAEKTALDKISVQKMIGDAAAELRYIFGFSFEDQKRLEESVWTDLVNSKSEEERKINLFNTAAGLGIIPQSMADDMNRLLSEMTNRKPEGSVLKLSLSDKIILLYKLNSIFSEILEDSQLSAFSQNQVELALAQVKTTINKYEQFSSAWEKDCLSQ